MKRIIIFFLLCIGISFLSLNERPTFSKQINQFSYQQQKNTSDKFIDSFEVEIQEDSADETGYEAIKTRIFGSLNSFFRLPSSRILFVNYPRLFTIQLFKLFNNYRI